mgnify:CR=1 FL=1
MPWVKDVPTTPGEDDGDDHHDEEDDGPVSVTSVSLNTKTLSLNEGESSTLSYTVSPANATNKNVKWSTDNPLIATVENGLVSAWKEGSTTITVTTLDQSKTDICIVTVSKPQPVQKEIETNFNLSEQNYPDSYHNKSLTNMPLECNGEYTVSFAVGTNSYKNQPALIKSGKSFEARVYWGNTFTVTSKTVDMCKIKFAFSANDSGNITTVSTGSFSGDTWTGSSKSVTFSVGGNAGSRAISAFSFFYIGQSDDDPNAVVNLGEMSIAEVKTYIAEHPVKKNTFGNGVNENRYVTIKGFALAKIDLEKFTADFGLEVSEHGKVILADNTDAIACATVVNNQGTSLWGKINEHVCKPTSKYIVTGYISEYLGHPEILVTSFAWDQTLNISWTASNLSKETVSLTEFYNKAANVNYNCAGHGYGDVVTVKDLTCYYIEADGQGKRYYNFTDGSKNIRVNAFNLGSVAEGSVYDVTGIISLKNLSPIIVAFEIKSSQSAASILDYESVATSITIQGLKAIRGSQDDTSTRYPDVVNAYGTIYKTTGYMLAVEEGGKLYVGITDTYRDSVITGKTNAMANYNVVLIKNDNFWNTTENELYLFNPIYDEYLLENKEITVYYVVRQLQYSSKKPMWEILLLPQFVYSLVPAEA